MAYPRHNPIRWDAIASILLALAIGSAPVVAALSLQASVVGGLQ